MIHRRSCSGLIAVALLMTLATTAHATTRGIQVVAKDSATGRTGQVELYRKSYAVIIGIDKYPNLPPDRQLSYAVHDAQGVEAVLRDNYRFDDVTVLYDRDATKENILKLFTVDLPKRMGPEDALFVFWAGHGNQESTRGGEIGYLIPYDGSAEMIYKNITMTQIRDTISKKIPAKHVFYVMDACYSGLLATRAIDPKISRDLSYLKEITKERVRQVLTAGAKGQEVLDGGPKGHSVFTGRLIEVLEARGDFITANELQVILKEKVYGDAKGRGHVQTPSFGILSGSGDYVFVPSAEHRLAEQRAAQERIAREIAEKQKEQEKIARELADLERLEQEAVAAKSEAKQRRAREEKQRLEGLQRLAKIRKMELEEEQRRQEETAEKLRQIEAERQRRIAEAQRQEEALRAEEERRKLEMVRLDEEQRAQRQAEEEHLVALKRELDAKRKEALAVADVLGIDAAVAEIKAQSARIDEIRGQFEAEKTRQEESIGQQYRQKIALLDKTRAEREAKAPKAPAEEPVAVTVAPKDEFETNAEYQARLDKAQDEEEARCRKARELREKILRAEEDSYRQVVSEAAKQRDLALVALRNRIAAETYEAIKPFQERVRVLANKEYTLGPDDLVFELGRYDAENETFPVSITSTTEGVQVAVNGTLSLPRAAARAFKTHYTSGLVRPEATVRAGDGQLTGAALVDEVEGGRRVFANGDFLTEEELAGEFVCLDGGSFEMGDLWGDGDSDEKPVHEVTVSAYCIGKTEVTQAQWQAVMGSNPSRFKGADRPVEQVSWNDVQGFLEKLNRKTGKTFRLPREAEWEYAARSGGKKEKWAGTSNAAELGRYAWYGEKSSRGHHPVGQKQPNGLGLYDMTGNVWEWVQDWYGTTRPRAQRNPMGPSSGSYRVLRGGGWDSRPRHVRSALRSNRDPGIRSLSLGFRLATVQ